MNVRNIYLNLFLDHDCLLKVGCSWSFLRHIQTIDTRTVTKTNKLVKNKNPFMTGRNSTFYSTGTCTFKKSVFPREFLFCYRVLFLFYAFKHNSVKYQEHQSSNSNGLQRKLHDMRQTVW